MELQGLDEARSGDSAGLDDEDSSGDSGRTDAPVSEEAGEGAE
jgi:hypothetical protein